MRSIQIVSALALSVLLGTTPDVCAQQSGQASILVTVVDEHGAVVGGAEVTIADPARGSKSVAKTTSAGTARVLELPPGSYEVIAAYDTSKAAAVVLLRAGVDATLQLTLRPATYVETVSVDASPRNLLDTRSPGQSVTMDGKDAMDVPVPGNRSWFNLINMVPGVAVLPNSNSSRNPVFFYFHGSDASQHVIVVDGADLSVGSVSLPTNIQMSTSTVNQLDAKVSGIDAASPLGWGLSLALETKSGTNKLTGSVVTSFQSANWFSSNVPGGATAASDTTLFDVSVGGPIIRNRAWFFSSERVARSSGQSGLTALEASTLVALTGAANPRPRAMENETYFNKATFAWKDSARQLAVSHQYDTIREQLSLSEYGVVNRLGGHVVNGRYSHVLRSSMLVRGNLAYNDKGFSDEMNRPDIPRRPVFSSILDSAGRLTGVTQLVVFGSTRPEWTSTPEAKVTGSVDLTASLRARGPHELKAGMYFDRHTREQLRRYSGNGRALEELVLLDPARPQLGVRPFHIRVYDSPSATLIDQVTSDVAFYAQDKWNATSRLTVSGGVRVDVVRSRDQLFGLTTQRTTEVGPNIGAAFAVTPTTVVRGYYGRRFSSLSEIAVNIGTAAIGFVDLYDANGDGTFERSLATPAAVQTRRDLIVDLDRWHVPHVDEFSAALERQLSKAISLGAVYLRRLYKDGPLLVDGNAIYDGMRFVGYRDESLNAIYQLTNNAYNHNVYDEVSVTSRLAFSRLNALASYTRQWRCHVGDWVPNDPASFLQPDAFRNCKGIGTIPGSTASLRDYDSLSGTSMTGGIQWRDHAANIAATVELLFGTQVAVDYRYQSGVWSGPIVTRVAAPDPRVGPSTITLSNGRVVSNPLATLIRFAGRDRSDGQIQTKAFQELNLALRKRFSVGRFNVQGGIEVFNLANSAGDLQFNLGANQLFAAGYGLGANRQPARTALIRFDATF
jgi:hypothetical protein